MIWFWSIVGVILAGIFIFLIATSERFDDDEDEYDPGGQYIEDEWR